MDNISRSIFWRLIKPEIAYYNKKWVGATEQEKKENERNVLSMYYKSLSHTTEYNLEVAFNRHREIETTFPKIPQILKFIPKESETYETAAYKRVPMPDSVSKIYHGKQVLSEQDKRDMAAMVNRRWSGTSAEEAIEIFNR